MEYILLAIYILGTIATLIAFGYVDESELALLSFVWPLILPIALLFYGAAYFTDLGESFKRNRL